MVNTPSKSKIPLPPQIKENQYLDHFNPIGDGNCGYRALAYALYKDQEKWLDVKAKMLDHLTVHENFFASLFGSEPFVDSNGKSWLSEYDRLKSQLINHAQDGVGTENWFMFPECPQLAADAFSVGISCFNPNGYQNCTFIPYHAQPTTLHPIALQLHQSHYYILNIKPKMRPTWPPAYTCHSVLCRKKNVEDYSGHYRLEKDDR